MKREKELAKPKRKPLYGKQRLKAEDDLWDISQDLKDLYADRGQLLIDMEEEAEAEGGPIADKYGSELNRIEDDIQSLIAQRSKLEMRLAESVVTEVVDLVHVYGTDGKMLGTGELVKTKGKKSLIRWDGSREEWVDSDLVKVVESKESDALAAAIDKAMIKIDDSMSYTDFALAVGKILKDEYGKHTFKGFMEVLHKDLGI
jgi:hypothetical protein